MGAAIGGHLQARSPRSTAWTRRRTAPRPHARRRTTTSSPAAGRGLFIGRGFGHKFDAVNSYYELDGVFDQWQYIPHNSYLGLLAFTGVFGFAGIWWPLPVCVFLAARAARTARLPVERTAAAVAVAEVIIYSNQAYGDMGLNSQTCLVLLASAYATAARVAVTSGAWGRPTKAAPDPAIAESTAA